MANHLLPFGAGWRSVARPLCASAALALLLSCGGGGGAGGEPPPPVLDEQTGVFSGFTGDLNWEVTGGGADAGVGGAADGDGGVGGGGDFGQFRNAMVVVKFPSGTELGRAPTDPNTGMVTIKPGKGYQGPLFVELQGGPNASYFEEGKGDFVPFPAGTVIRVWVPKITKNIGITAFTDAGYRLLTEGSTPERATGTPTAAQIGAANDKIRDVLNQQFPNTLHVDDITRLPFIKSPSIGPGSISIDPRGRYGLVNGAFSKQAAMFNANEPTPTLAALKHFGEDMLDGKLDGSNGAQPAAPADKRTYDPHTLTGELSSALAEQSFRFGDDKSKLALPKLLNFGNTRYEGYLFDASLRADGKAFDTVAGWVTDNSKNRNLGDSFDKLPDVKRTFAVFANHGHGSVFFKAINPVDDKDNSQSKIFAVGDNVNGELGIGTNTSTGGKAVEVQMPAGLTLTHIAGGFAHTVARFADGSVYAWGDNSYGQLGQGMDANALPRSLTPVKVNLPAGAAAVAATSTAAYALLADGRVYSWGSNGGFGLLGDGDKNGERTTPAPVLAVGGSLTDVVQIAARDNDAIAVRRDGSVLTWGSYPADPDGGFTEHELGAPYRGGTPLPTPVAGFPQGLEIRKILTEQGLFAALASDGAVYTWGVYFDLTAQQVLRDLVPVRVLGLPPVRDLMPGGFNGYGQRPFDRLTSTAIDDRGGMWKVRGRVAEQFDPDNPAQQRRPKSAVARPDCASCHLVLTDWPLTPPAPTSGNVCVPPSEFHGNVGDPANSLIHADTKCEQCHNPARSNARPSFTDGWLNCIRPDNLPPRPQLVTPPADTESCTAPAGHVFTPPGTTCASCHNSVIARPLQQIPGPTPGKVCGQPPSTALPSIRTTATITSAVNDAGASIPAGTSTRDTTPTLQGTLSTPLIAGQSVAVRRNGTTVGTVTPSGTAWSLTDPGAPGGSQPYSARVEAGSAIGPTSATYTIVIDTLAPAQTANVTGIADDSGPLANGASTVDSTPTVSGSLSAALGAGESLQVLRSIAGAPAGTPPFVINVVPTGLAFTFPDSALSAATYIYQARIVDTAGNEGSLGASRSVTISTSFAAPTITAVNGSTPAGGAVPPTRNRSFAVTGTFPGALPSGTSIRVYQRTGTSGGFTQLAGSAGVTPGTSTSWSHAVAGPLEDQVHAFFARVESLSPPPLVGAQSETVSIIVDNTAAATPVSLRATSDVRPFNNLFANNTPADLNSFLDQGPEGNVTNDLRPRLVVTLGAPLAADATRAAESVILVRGGSAITLPTAAIPATACPPGSGATTLCFTDNTASALSLASPLSSPGAASRIDYELFVRDAAGNESKRVPLALSFDYVFCTQAQANGGGETHTGGDITNKTTNCNGCHNTAQTRGAIVDPPSVRPMPYGIGSGIFVAVPPSGAYWCKRP